MRTLMVVGNEETMEDGPIGEPPSIINMNRLILEDFEVDGLEVFVAG